MRKRYKKEVAQLLKELGEREEETLEERGKVRIGVIIRRLSLLRQDQQHIAFPKTDSVHTQLKVVFLIIQTKLPIKKIQLEAFPPKNPQILPKTQNFKALLN